MVMFTAVYAKSSLFGRLSKLQEDIKLIVRDFNKKINNCNDITRDCSDQLLHKMESLQQRWHKEHVHLAELVQNCVQQLDKANKVQGC